VTVSHGRLYESLSPQVGSAKRNPTQLYDIVGLRFASPTYFLRDSRKTVSGGVQKLHFCMGQPGDAAVQKNPDPEN
jgi:hypothetical protein